MSGVHSLQPTRFCWRNDGFGVRMRRPLLAWERFAADEANLTEFLNAKGKRR